MTEGTWAWACERMLEGKMVKRPDVSACRLDPKTDLIEVCVAREWVLMTRLRGYGLNRQDFESTDWEVVESA